MDSKRHTSRFASTNYTIKPSIGNILPALKSCKVLTLGDTTVGKTTLISHYCDDDYKYQSKSISTVGIDTKSVKHYEDGIKILFWDTAGQERFRNITSSYFKDADMVLFVYSIDNYEYFKSIQNWINQLQEYKTKTNLIKILIGTKKDLPTREVSESEALSFANKYNMQFFEVSNKTKENINESYKYIKNELINKSDEDTENPNKNSFFLDDKKKVSESKSDCC